MNEGGIERETRKEGGGRETERKGKGRKKKKERERREEVRKEQWEEEEKCDTKNKLINIFLMQKNAKGRGKIHLF